jgi:hypothetical protein
MSNKLRGEWAELCFMAAAANHGFRVAKPFGECGRYDTVIERNGVFLRVQVKSTIHRQDGCYICGLRPSNANPYNEGEIEFLAAYIVPEDLWYILPVSVVSPLVGAIWLSPHKVGAKHDRYKEAWWLLVEATDRRASRRRTRRGRRRAAAVGR